MWIDTFGGAALRAPAAAQSMMRRGSAAEGDGGDLVDARQGDDNQRDQQQGAESQREGGAGHEVMSVPECKQRRRPGADDVGGAGEQHRLAALTEASPESAATAAR